jgi:hypothetical protein
MKREANKRAQGTTVATVLPTHEQIASRAYQIYLERGCQHGHDLDDWLQAEYELLQLPVDELAKLKPPKTETVHRSVVHVVRSAMY